MIPQLASQSLTIEQLFSAPFLFVSPSFQRPYSWQVETAERLLGDLLAASSCSHGEVYFLGALLLVDAPVMGDIKSNPPADGGARVFEIIDGQQRIVTLAILAAVLRDLWAEANPMMSKRFAAAVTTAGSDHARVRLRRLDDEFLRLCISAPGAVIRAPQVEPISDPQRRILDIRDFFVRQLQVIEPEDLQRLAVYLLEKCAVVAIVTNTIDRAYQMFTVLNDSGEPLTRNDILKAELIGQIAQADRARATEVWEEAEQRLGNDFEQLFSFLRSRSAHANEPIVEALRAEVAEMPGGAAAFVFDVLVPASRIVARILGANHQGAPESPRINNLLRYLGWLPGQEWIPPVLAFWSRYGADAAALLEFLTAMDRFAYGARLQGLGAGKRTQRMAATTALIESGRAARGPWLPLQFGRDELRAIQFSLRDLHKRSPQICRLLLMRLDEYFGGPPLSPVAPMTVEHILPLRVASGARWSTDFPDADMRLKLATCLGNLTLVPGPINERAANHDFAKKLAIYFSGDNQISKLTEELRHVAGWTPAAIETRLTRLTNGLRQLWGWDDGVSAR